MTFAPYSRSCSESAEPTEPVAGGALSPHRTSFPHPASIVGRAETVTDSEEFWVLRAQAGDREALELLLRAVQPALTRYLSGLVGARFADDVTQDVLLTIHRKLWWLRSPALFRPWTFRIASRAAFRLLTREGRWPDHRLDDDALDQNHVPAKR